MNNDHQRLLGAMRMIATKERPYFSTGLFALALLPTAGVQSFAIDQFGRVYINIERVVAGDVKKPKPGQWTIQEGAFVLIHELQHWLMKHFERALPYIMAVPEEDRDAEARFINFCQDLEINGPMYEEAKQPTSVLKAPEDGVYPQNYKLANGQPLPVGMPWEWYYNHAETRKIEIKTQWDCGSGAHGLPRPWEVDAPSQDVGKGKGKAAPPPMISRAEAELIRDSIAREIVSSCAYGNVPAGLERWARSRLVKPEVPWERELYSITHGAVVLSQPGHSDYSYDQQSRHGAVDGLILPRMVQTLAKIAAVVDTSGSMGEKELIRALSEIFGVCRVLQQSTLPVICCDANAYEVQYIRSPNQVKLKGGGGTDMRVGIAEAEKLKPDVIVVYTDGFTEWPAQEPRSKVIACIINSNPELLEQLRAENKVCVIPPWLTRVVTVRCEDIEERGDVDVEQVPEEDEDELEDDDDS